MQTYRGPPCGCSFDSGQRGKLPCGACQLSLCGFHAKKGVSAIARPSFGPSEQPNTKIHLSLREKVAHLSAYPASTPTRKISMLGAWVRVGMLPPKPECAIEDATEIYYFVSSGSASQPDTPFLKRFDRWRRAKKFTWAWPLSFIRPM